jgi:hypothetical protein
MFDSYSKAGTLKAAQEPSAYSLSSEIIGDRQPVYVGTSIGVS